MILSVWLIVEHNDCVVPLVYAPLLLLLFVVDSFVHPFVRWTICFLEEETERERKDFFFLFYRDHCEQKRSSLNVNQLIFIEDDSGR